MVIIDFIIDKIFWAFIGAAGTVLWFKASYTCTDAIVSLLCIPHKFDLPSAFGI